MTFRRRLANAFSGSNTGSEERLEGSAGSFAAIALERHRREGMELAFRARWVALAIFAVMLPAISSIGTALYFQGLIVLLIVVGWLQRRMATLGRSKLVLLLACADILIMTVAIAAPNPLQPLDWPPPMQLRSGAFMYFYVFLAFGTLAYSWWTVLGIGSVTALIWTAAIVLVWAISTPDAGLAAAAKAAFGHSRVMLDYLDPNSLLAWVRVQEIIVFLVVAWILSTTVRRFSRLLMHQAQLERERTNLARYFSPNVVEDLSRNDEPLKSIRNQDVAVMFVDIVGFTKCAANRPAKEVIETLRAFHGRMEAEVFQHNGTLDKFLGDGLMATFGTPAARETDAHDALSCARGMTKAMDTWNADREANGEPPIRISIGVHHGPAVLGDIGKNRLEFAVIGDTVNVASRVEGLTRQLGVRIAATNAAMTRARAGHSGGDDPTVGFTDLGAHQIRGLEREVGILGRH